MEKTDRERVQLLMTSVDVDVALRYPTWRRQKNANRGKSVTEEWNEVDHLYAVAARFKQAQIECRPALDVITHVDGPEVLFYVDPPYPMSTRRGNDTEYGHEMTDADHIELLEVLKSLQGMVILSGYRCEMYDELLVEWQRKDRSTSTNGQGSAVESLWLSPAVVDVTRLPLFASAGGT